MMNDYPENQGCKVKKIFDKARTFKEYFSPSLLGEPACR
jgi:hypothetical protein